MTAPLILAFDTSAAHCAAALLRGDDILDARTTAMSKGQAEHLMPFLETLLADHGHAWSDLTRIGVGTGPGNFTGIRISVSAARGLALALGVPAIGVSTFDAIHHGAPGALAAVTAPRGHLYVQRPGDPPLYLAQEQALLLGTPRMAPDPGALVAAMARCAAAATPGAAPAPLYIKPADAAPSRDAPPVMLP